MDYLTGVTLHEHASWTHFQATLPLDAHVTAFSTRATYIHTTAPVSRGMYLLFGPESVGLPEEGLMTIPDVASINSSSS